MELPAYCYVNVKEDVFEAVVGAETGYSCADGVMLSKSFADDDCCECICLSSEIGTDWFGFFVFMEIAPEKS